MSYGRIAGTGTYIWSDGKNLHFLDKSVPEDDINIFLYNLYTNRYSEFEDRLQQGKRLIDQYLEKMKECEDFDI